MIKHKNEQGFTLVELSIVVVIIGLLIGGVVVGNAMLSNAKLQSILSDADKYKKSIQLFKDKYKEYPGDFSGATALWGTDAGGCPATTANIITKTATCNGNGDGFIGESSGSTPLGQATANNGHYEPIRMWQHLSNAGMIDAAYTGAVSSANSSLDPGVNAPASKMLPATFNAYYVGYLDPVTPPPEVFVRDYKHILIFGVPQATIDIAPSLPIIYGPEAYGLDAKVDDGRPATGHIVSYTANGSSPAPDCVIMSGTDFAATYKTSSFPTKICSLIFITGY